MITKKEKRIKQIVHDSIRLLRFLSGGEGFVEVNLFDAGAGGGFSSGTVMIHLERSGLNFDKTVYTTEELAQMLEGLVYSRLRDSCTKEEIAGYFFKHKWND